MVRPEAETFPVETAKQIAMTCSDILGEALLTSNCVPWSMSQILSWSHQNCVGPIFRAEMTSKLTTRARREALNKESLETRLVCLKANVI